MFQVYSDSIGFEKIPNANKKLIFNQRQTYWILFFMAINILICYFCWESIEVKKIIDDLFVMSVSLFGFTLTSYTVLISLSNTALIERLKKDTNLYNSVMVNISWLLYILFFDIVISYESSIFYDSNKLIFKNLFFIIIISSIVSLTFLLLWYACSRLSRILRNV